MYDMRWPAVPPVVTGADAANAMLPVTCYWWCRLTTGIDRLTVVWWLRIHSWCWRCRLSILPSRLMWPIHYRPNVLPCHRWPRCYVDTYLHRWKLRVGDASDRYCQFIPITLYRVTETSRWHAWPRLMTTGATTATFNAYDVADDPAGRLSVSPTLIPVVYYIVTVSCLRCLPPHSDATYSYGEYHLFAVLCPASTAWWYTPVVFASIRCLRVPMERILFTSHWCDHDLALLRRVRRLFAVPCCIDRDTVILLLRYELFAFICDMMMTRWWWHYSSTDAICYDVVGWRVVRRCIIPDTRYSWCRCRWRVAGTAVDRDDACAYTLLRLPLRTALFLYPMIVRPILTYVPCW